ncbi:MAG: alpha/beta hydrolase [Desulfuromonadales bacterium]|nr:alpha/beta hydrolase [Desulfuromonadales bacterium]
MKTSLLFLILLPVVLTLQIGCARTQFHDPEFATIDSSNLPAPDLALEIPGLSSCTTEPDATVTLNSYEPVTIIVHGCASSAGRFRSLSQVFAFHGQQTVCFNYDDRDSLMQSSKELIAALSALSAKMNNLQITVIGHSQGGLISRAALTEEREDKFVAGDKTLRLVSVSAPYAGIAAADHCASVTARVLSLGLVIPVCRLISGEKWYEITFASPFVQQPGELLEEVSSHLKIVTNEKGTCRNYDQKGVCVEDDFVFSTKEQYLKKIDISPRVDNVEVEAGHVEIVGNYNVTPVKLIEIMQAKEIMSSTPPDRREKLSQLLSQLYLH